MPPRGLQHTAIPSLSEAVSWLLQLLYSTPSQPKVPSKNARKAARNAEIQALYVAGWTIPQLARRFSISNARVHQLLKTGNRLKRL